MDRYTAYICLDCALQGLIIYGLASYGYLNDEIMLGVAVAVTGMATKPLLAMLMKEM